MNKEKSRSPKKHEFLLNLAKSPPLSVDHFDFLSMQPHSKDSSAEEDEQVSLHQERVATATDFPLGKNHHAQASLSQGKRSHSKKKSVDHPKDAVTYLQSTPSSTTNAKASGKPSQSRTISRSNTAHHLNFLNSKEFAKFALSKVLPKDIKKDKAIHLELSPQHKRSQAGSLEKSPPKNFPKEDNGSQQKYHLAATKKQKMKPRASNLTYNDFSSLVDQTRHINSFMNSPQKKSAIQFSIPTTKSTTNLRPMTTKNSNQMAKNAWQLASNEAFRKLEGRKNQGAVSHEEPRSKERNKGMQSIASILNLRRDKKSSPEKKANSCYPGSNHRKVASIGCNAQNSFNHSHLNSQPVQLASSQLVSPQDDYKGSIQRSPSRGKKSSASPLKRDGSAGKKVEVESFLAKGVNLENYAGLQHTFEYLLEKYRCDMQNAQETYNLLKQAKQAYEAFIRDLLNQLKVKKEINPVSSLENLKMKCNTLKQEKGMLEEEVKYLRIENQRLYSLMSDFREREEETDGRVDTSKGGFSKGTDDKLEDLLTCPPTQKLSSNSDNLKRIILDQHHVIETLQNKEMKLMQLLYTIHKQGFDVEKLLQEEAMKDAEHSERQFMASSVSSKRNLEIHGETSSRNSVSNGSRIEICSLITSNGDISDIIPDLQELKEKYGLTGLKAPEASPLLGVGGLSTLSAPMKDKLKLDFKALPHTNSSKKFGAQGQQPDNNAEPQGFHEEFMAKIEEFSLSWRQEALKQRNI